jgi:hypothetical protein
LASGEGFFLQQNMSEGITWQDRADMLLSQFLLLTVVTIFLITHVAINLSIFFQLFPQQCHAHLTAGPPLSFFPSQQPQASSLHTWMNGESEKMM